MKKLWLPTLLFFIVFSGASQVPSDSIVAFYPFNGNADDESGNDNHGTVNGATLTNDRFGNPNSAYYFDGTDDYIQVLPAESINPATTDGYTISLWGSCKGDQNTNRFINISNLTEDSNYDITLQDKKIYFFNWGGGFSLMSQEEITLESWYHVVVSIDYTLETAFLYINNEHIDSKDSLSIQKPDNPYVTIGKHTMASWHFYGSLDDIRIYNRAIDAQEVSALFKEGICFETIYDTITTEVFDTTHVTVYDSISVTDTLIIDAVLTGIDPPDNINTLKIYPNPANEHIFISTGDYNTMAGYSMKIINQIGVTVFETNIEEPLYEVNLSTWSGIGLYYVQVIDSGGNIIEIRKIVLQ